MTQQAANSIVIDASNVTWTDTTYRSTSGTFVRPLRALTSTTAVYYNATTFELTYLSSSATTKNTIEDLAMDTSIVDNLRPRTYYYNSDPSAGIQVGYIAEEVKELNPHFATYNTPGGDPVAINYNSITVFLVEELKKLKYELTLSNNELANSEAEIEVLKNKITILENK
jgi:hypothetical protein